MRVKFQGFLLVCLTLLPLNAISIRAQIALANIDTSGNSCESGGKDL